MYLVTRMTDYAVRALVYIAGSGERLVSSAQIEDELKLPRPFMRRILQQLQHEGYLESIRGNKGGFMLKKDPAKIKLSDIAVVFQGHVNISECLLNKKVCRNIKTCPLRKRLKGIQDIVIKEFAAITLADLIEDNVTKGA